MHVVACFRASRGGTNSALPFDDSALSDAIIQQEFLRDVRDQVHAKVD
jgi:hypothetical protein